MVIITVGLFFSDILSPTAAYLLSNGGDDMNEEETLILDEMRRIEAMLYKNEQLFDLAESGSDTEALVYEHKALELRRSALIEKAKKSGIRRDYKLCMK